MRPFQDSFIWKIIDFLGEVTKIPENWSKHIISLQFGFFDKIYMDAFNIFRIWYRDPPSLFMNGFLFIQLRLPFWIGIGFRPFTEHYFQTGLGWKGNGRFAILCRIQTDESASIGMDGPNYGQAIFMKDGTK